MASLSKNFFFLFFLSSLNLLLFSGCLVYSPKGGEYWSNWLDLNQAMRDQFRGTNDLSILYGSLNPEDEDRLFKISDKKFYLGISAKKQGGGSRWGGRSNAWLVRKSTKTDPKAEFRSKTTYTHTQSGKYELYEVARKEYGKLGDYKPSLTFMGISKIISENIQSTESQRFLCKAFTCNESKSNIPGKVKTYSYTFSSLTKARYPAFYEKFGDRLEKLTFRAVSSPDGKNKSSIVVENRGKTILVHLPPKGQGKDWISPKSVVTNLDFSIRSYGLHFEVKNLIHNTRFKKTKLKGVPREEIQFFFGKLPNYKIEGRFLYVIPQGLINFFIPEDIDSYIGRAIELVTVGSNGKKGNRITIKYIGEGKNAFYETRAYSEIHRKKFSLFGKKDPKLEEGRGNANIWFRDLLYSIVADLVKK